MAKKIIRTWLNSGANIDSTYEVCFEVDADKWDNYTEEQKDQLAKDYSWQNMDWGWTEVTPD